jgi:hypothetical protein
MSFNALMSIGAGLVILAALALWPLVRSEKVELDATITPGPEETNGLHSNGVVAFTRPEDFGLAISDTQILTEATIPPCESGFEYCLYYLSDKYAHTNFESAGVAITSRTDLTSESTCLSTAPIGYSDIEPAAITTNEGYSISVFTPLQNAGAGHYTNSSEYRLYTAASCYQITARIAEAQFANFPPGTVEEFTGRDREDLFARLLSLIESMTLTATNESLTLP